MHENLLSYKIINAALRVHKSLGPGLLESAYENCLAHMLLKDGYLVEKQKPMPLVYENVKLEAGYRVDLLINKKIIVEVKAVDAINEVHIAQVITYLKLSGCNLGLLINFNAVPLKTGIRRIIHGELCEPL